MSGGNPSKSASRRSEVSTQEDRNRKSAAIQDINKIFGAGEYGNRREDVTVNPGRDRIREWTDLHDPRYRSLRGKDKFGYKKNRGRGPDVIPGEDPAVYAAKKQAWESGRDANKGAREALYEGNRNAVLDVNTKKLDKDLTESERQMRFALARSGLFSGSEDIAQHDKQRSLYDEGTLQATSTADQAAAGFRGADEKARLDVISQIQSGVDSSTALNNARRGLEISASDADANSKGKIIGNVFSDAGLIYDQQNRAAGINDARSRYRDGLGAYIDNRTGYRGVQR